MAALFAESCADSTGDFAPDAFSARTLILRPRVERRTAIPATYDLI
jgi:hypothetical protein